MTYLLDRSALIHLLTQCATPMRDRMRAAQQRGDRLAMSAVTLAELETIAGRISDDADVRKVLDQLQSTVEVLAWPADAALALARMPPAPGAAIQDLQVAAHALATSADLVVAGTPCLPRIPGLSFVDWTRPASVANPG
jgi:predicted nucleic acid-binding protein